MSISNHLNSIAAEYDKAVQVNLELHQGIAVERAINADLLEALEKARAMLSAAGVPDGLLAEIDEPIAKARKP